MNNLRNITFTSEDTGFDISILEDFGWIEPVFLLISPKLIDILRLKEEPCYLINVKHFEILNLAGNCYGIHFFNSNDIIRGDSKDLKIVKANFIEEKKIYSKTYSLFSSSFCFKNSYNHLEYSFFYIANGTSYLTHFSSFAVENY